jgi:OHCU decarboxylase
MPLSPRPSSLDRDAFVDAFGGVYEHSPWVAEAVFDAGLSAADDTVDALHARLRAVVEAAGAERQLALLRAHPELAGKLAVAGELTAASRSEQSGAGLDRCTPDEFARFTELNASYRAKFGFPFIIAVKGLTRADILTAFAARVGQHADAEHRTALDQVHRIARLRLEAMRR